MSTSINIPTIETERLVLRAFQLADFDALFPFLSDPDMARYRTGEPLSRDEAWEWVVGNAGQWMVRGYGIFAAEERATGTFVGFGGPWHPIVFDEPELAYSLLRAHHGKGFATELATAARDWIFETLDVAPFSLVHPDNHPSRRVAERLGATIESQTVFCDQPRLVYRHTKPN